MNIEHTQHLPSIFIEERQRIQATGATFIGGKIVPFVVMSPSHNNVADLSTGHTTVEGVVVLAGYQSHKQQKVQREGNTTYHAEEFASLTDEVLGPELTLF